MCGVLLCLMSRYWGINVQSRGFLTSELRGHAPTIQNSRRETSSCLPQTTWVGQILTLHLNYVAGYTGPLPGLFLFERTQQLTPVTTRGKPWRLRVWAGSMFVRTHQRGVTRTPENQYKPQKTVLHGAAGRRNRTDDLRMGSPSLSPLN